MTTAAITRDFRISDLLRQVWPRHAAKQAAAASGLSVRTAQGWMADRCSPSAETLLRMARENNALRAALLHALNGETSEHDPQMGDRVFLVDRRSSAPNSELGA